MPTKKDQQIKAEVQSLIDNNIKVKDYGIKAEVIDGEVHLTGLVDTLHQKRQLHEVISRVKGIRSLENGVSISTDGRINDADITAEVYEELKHNRVNLEHIGAETRDGTVVLRGRADDTGEIQNAMEAASRARGVKDVINHINMVDEGAAALTLKDLFHSQVNNDQEDDAKFDGIE